MVLVAAVVAAAAVELFTVLRRAGYHPATLLGIASAVTLPLASYWKGESAYPVVLFLTAVFGLLWYLVGAGGDDSPVLGISSTMFVVGYVAVLGSFAALILTLPDGIGVLYGALLTTVAYDVGAFFVGRSLGTRSRAWRADGSSLCWSQSSSSGSSPLGATAASVSPTRCSSDWWPHSRQRWVTSVSP